MLMGGKVESKYFKDAEKKCVIEATFDISDYGYRPFFEENELDYDDECVIRKEITPSGKARSFVNDTPVSVSQLKQIGEMLIDLFISFIATSTFVLFESIKSPVTTIISGFILFIFDNIFS